MPSSPQPERIVATALDLPPAVAAALAEPGAGSPETTRAAGITFASVRWGVPDDPPLLLVHGVTSSSGTWWRVGPALAATGRNVVAVDLPGHGRTGAWKGRHRFSETAADLAAFVREAGLDRPDLAIVGHSWGAVTVAHLPRAGVRPDRLVLLDPPALPVSVLAAITTDPVERHYDDLDEAIHAIGSAYPTWAWGDVVEKADALTRFDAAAVRGVLLDNGDWDGGLAALADPAARRVAAWVVRGEPASGGYLPDEATRAFRAAIGADHVLTIAGGPHSPHRTHPEATVLALLRALGGTPVTPLSRPAH